MRVFLTGHTGFKGSWFVPYLSALGHEVIGYSLGTQVSELYKEAQIASFVEQEFFGDVRDQGLLEIALLKANPDVVIHFAAQALVRTSYQEPRFTFETNFNGTLNVLVTLSKLPNLKSTLIVTTDKVYRIENVKGGFSETHALSGSDPYSASKAAADLLTQSWVKSNTEKPINIARAGNVIGGGDWSKDRLIPDIFRSIQKEEETILRFPEATRPWQHVLDCLNGYWMLIQNSIETGISSEWNFGPKSNQILTVGQVASLVLDEARPGRKWERSSVQDVVETTELSLNSDKARTLLNWEEKLTNTQAIKMTTNWYMRNLAGESAQKLLLEDIEGFLSK